MPSSSNASPSRAASNSNSNQNASSSNTNQNKPPLMGFMSTMRHEKNQPRGQSSTLVCSLSNTNSPSTIGPIVDDGAPFSAIGEI